MLKGVSNKNISPLHLIELLESISLEKKAKNKKNQQIKLAYHQTNFVLKLSKPCDFVGGTRIWPMEMKSQMK